jgi:hypothetical protein
MRLIYLLPFLPALAASIALPQPHLPARNAHPKRQTARVASAVHNAVTALPKPGLPANALLVTGHSVDLLPVSPNTEINSDTYRTLTRQLPTVMTHAIESSKHSWEIGSLVESLLEVYVPRLAPFEFSRAAFNADIPWAALWVVEAWLKDYDWSGSPGNDNNPTSVVDLAQYLDASTSPTGLWPKPLINGDGALGDPVAMGMGVWLLARYAMRPEVRSGLRSGLSSSQLAWACGNQLAYLRQGATSDNGQYALPAKACRADTQGPSPSARATFSYGQTWDR